MKSPSTYASSAAMSRAIRTFEKAGMHVGSVRLAPDGSIEIFRAEAVPIDPANDFDRLEAQGLL